MKRLATEILVILLLINNVASQSGGNRAQTINNIFQIPIQTLTAISNFAQNTRPLGEVIQRRRNPRPVQPSQTFANTYPTYSSYSGPRSRAAQIAGLYTASDGSGFRI